MDRYFSIILFTQREKNFLSRRFCTTANAAVTWHILLSDRCQTRKTRPVPLFCFCFFTDSQTAATKIIVGNKKRKKKINALSVRKGGSVEERRKSLRKVNYNTQSQKKKKRPSSDWCEILFFTRTEPNPAGTLRGTRERLWQNGHFSRRPGGGDPLFHLPLNFQ